MALVDPAVWFWVRQSLHGNIFTAYNRGLGGKLRRHLLIGVADRLFWGTLAAKSPRHCGIEDSEG